MAQEGTISPGISHVGARAQGSYFAYSGKQHKPPQISQLKAGEIVLGTVLDNPEFDIAPVRLPQGVFSAQLQGHLKKADSLFFIVQETLPALILKIHSVGIVKNGEMLSPQEIIRILDIPLTDNSMKITSAVAESRRTIERKTLAHCLLFWDMPENRAQLKNSDFQSAVATLLNLTEAGNLNSQSYEQFYPIFRRSELVLNDLLNTPDLSEALSKCKTPEDYILFYKTAASSAAPYINSLANSLNLWNIYAAQNTKQLKHCFVLPFAESYAAVSISVENTKANFAAASKAYLTSNIALTLLRVDFKSINSKLKLLAPEKGQNYLYSVAAEVQKVMNSQAYSLTSFKVSTKEFNDLEYTSATTSSASTNFSVVV